LRGFRNAAQPGDQFLEGNLKNSAQTQQGTDRNPFALFKALPMRQVKTMLGDHVAKRPSTVDPHLAQFLSEFEQELFVRVGQATPSRPASFMDRTLIRNAKPKTL
jgi:hypothetical protein